MASRILRFERLDIPVSIIAASYHEFPENDVNTILAYSDDITRITLVDDRQAEDGIRQALASGYDLNVGNNFFDIILFDHALLAYKYMPSYRLKLVLASKRDELQRQLNSDTWSNIQGHYYEPVENILNYSPDARRLYNFMKEMYILLTENKQYDLLEGDLFDVELSQKKIPWNL